VPVINKTYVNPFYQSVSDYVRTELTERGVSYGARVRSSNVRDPERLMWSYSKIAWAKVFPSVKGAPSLGTNTSNIMSDSYGKLTLYDSTRNQPKFPLLQSLTITNEGTVGSLLKATFEFVVYPDLTKNGFKSAELEQAYFKPGRDVKIQWGWSVRGGAKANKGELDGIIYNFNWSVNPDLSINAKCSVVSKGTIALGLSGESNNPDADSDTVDPKGNPIPDGDLAGVLEADTQELGGDKNTSVSLKQKNFIPSSDTKSGKKNPGKGYFSYHIIPLPRSLRDADTEKLSDEQKKKQEEDKKALEEAEKGNAAINTYAPQIAKKLKEKAGLEKQKQELEKERDLLPAPEQKRPFTERITNIDAKIKELNDEIYNADGLYNKAFDDAGRDPGFYQGIAAALTGDSAVLEKRKQFEDKLKKRINELISSTPPSTTSTNTTPNPATSNTSFKIPDPPEPISEPFYFVPLWQIAAYMNDRINKGPIGSIARIDCLGHETEYNSEIVSCIPDKVFFPDPDMGRYGEFKPFSTTEVTTDFKIGEREMLDIGKILLSTTCVIETYREFLEENQTNISYKNITGFWDALIKKINYASSEVYQLTARVVEPESLTGGKLGQQSILSIEDSNLSQKVTDKVIPYPFTATIAKPILKSINISSHPPGPLASAAYVDSRSGKGSQQLDVKVKTGKDDDPKAEEELKKAKENLEKQKNSLLSLGLSDKYSTDLKGLYSTYKRASTSAKKAHWLNKAIYPVDLSLTIDGINGFKFGDVITTNLVPATYKDEGLVFVVTKVNHSIQNGIWETTLETKARLNAGA